jgi:hypothetical protein
MDTIGPLPEAEDGSKYILVLIDSFTRHVQLTACIDVSAETAANALVKHMSRFGRPKELITDQGTQYVNALFKAITQHFGFHHFNSIPYSKEENGIVERANKEVNRHVRNIMFDSLIRDQWHAHLLITEHVMNSSIKEPTGVAPNTLLYGHHAGAVDEAFFLPVDDITGLTLTVRQYLDNLYATQHKVIAAAQNSQRLTHDNQIAKRLDKQRSRKRKQIQAHTLVGEPTSKVAHNQHSSGKRGVVAPLDVQATPKVHWTKTDEGDWVRQPSLPIPSFSDTVYEGMVLHDWTMFQKGDYVLRIHPGSRIGHGPPDKYGSYWRGPYLVVDRQPIPPTGKFGYVLRNLVTQREG